MAKKQRETIEEIVEDIIEEATEEVVEDVVEEIEEALAKPDFVKTMTDQNRIRIYFEENKNYKNICIKDAEINGVDFRTQKFDDSRFENIKFSNCVFQGCNFSEMDGMVGCSFKNCDLRWTSGLPEEGNEFINVRV